MYALVSRIQTFQGYHVDGERTLPNFKILCNNESREIMEQVFLGKLCCDTGRAKYSVGAEILVFLESRIYSLLRIGSL